MNRTRVTVSAHSEMKIHSCTKCSQVWSSNNTAASKYINMLCPNCIGAIAPVTWRTERVA